MDLNVDGEGYLVDRTQWTAEVASKLAKVDGYELSDARMDLIVEARKIYDDAGIVPPIRKFSKTVGMSSKELYELFPTGPMKMICKWGGLPKPTGCV